MVNLDELRKYFEDKKLTQMEIAEELGVSKAYVNALMSGRKLFGKKQAEIWENRFGLSKSWLLTGEGPMTKDKTEHSRADEEHDDSDEWVPLLPVSAMAGPLQLFSEGIELKDCQKIKSPVKGADWAIQISGDSMLPDLKNGMYIFIRRISGSFIPWGNTMVIDTYDGVIVKNLYPVPDNPEVIEARSSNPAFPPFLIEKSIVIGLYRVLGGLFINSTI